MPFIFLLLLKRGNSCYFELFFLQIHADVCSSLMYVSLRTCMLLITLYHAGHEWTLSDGTLPHIINLKCTTTTTCIRICADNLLKKPWNKQLKTETGGNFCSLHFQNWFHKAKRVANIQTKAGNIVAWNYF